MGIKNDQLATAAGIHPVQYGSAATILVVGDNIVVPVVPAGKTRCVSLIGEFNSSFACNYDNTSHDLFYKIGATTITKIVTVPSGSQSFPVNDNFENMQAIALAAGETLVVNVATAINIAGSVTAIFSWCDLDATVVAAPRVSIPSTTPVVIVAAPPLGKARRVGAFDELFQTNGYFYNGDSESSVGLTVELVDNGVPVISNVLDINAVTILAGRGLMLPETFGLTGTQALRAYLDSTPGVPLQFYGVYKTFPKTL
jgi:hypothetical protein